jgi:hypothetical protein
VIALRAGRNHATPMTAIGFCLIRPLASHDCNGDKGIARWAVFLAERCHVLVDVTSRR